MRDPYELWLNQVCESPETRKNHLVGIKRFEAWVRENYGVEAREIPSNWRAAKYAGIVEREKYLDQLNDILKDYFADLKGAYTPLTVNYFISTVISYLHAFDIPVKALKIRHAYVTYHNRDITKKELRQMLEHSNVRNRAAYMILYESGMRPDTLVKLRWRHIKDEFLGHKNPMKISLSSDILKCRVSERWTFIGQEGFEALKRYLGTRGPLKEEDYVFVREKPKGDKLGAAAVSQAFNRLVKKLGLAEQKGPKGRKPKDLRLYCLRKAFRKFMIVEEAYKEFWMGHTSTAVHYVSRDPEYHRKLYAEGYENLRLEKPSPDVAVISKLAGENLALKANIETLEERFQTLVNGLTTENIQLKDQMRELSDHVQNLEKKWDGVDKTTREVVEGRLAFIEKLKKIRPDLVTTISEAERTQG